jgi:hypothetical protein
MEKIRLAAALALVAALAGLAAGCAQNPSSASSNGTTTLENQKRPSQQGAY